MKPKKMLYLLSLSLVFLAPFGSQVKAEEAVEAVDSNIEIANDGAQVSQTDVQDFITKARQVSFEYASKNLKTLDSTPQTFNYTFVDGDVGYFYEKSSDDNKEFVATYPVEDTDSNQVASPSEKSSIGIIPASQGGPMSDGIGGKVTISKNGNISSFVIHTPASTTGPTSRTYIYGGFSGTGANKADTVTNRTIEADMGLVFSNAYGLNKWQPIINYYWGSDLPGEGHETPGNRLAGYDEVYYQNGYIPGNDVNVSIYRNLNNNTRLSTSGYAINSKHDLSGTSTSYLTAVTEISKTKVSSTSSWKYVTTIADTQLNNKPQYDAAGSVVGIINNISLDSVATTPVFTLKDYATVTINGNSVTISVSK